MQKAKEILHEGQACEQTSFVGCMENLSA